MLTFFAILLILATVSVHELGHAWAMNERGVAIKRISLMGVPWPNITWRLPIRWKRFPDTEWVMHPLVIGAYVEPKDDMALDKIPPRDRVYIAAMGPIASIAIGIVLIGLAVTAIRIDAADAITAGVLYPITIAIASLAALWLLRDFIARFICPFVGVTMIGLVIWTVVQFGIWHSFMGPVGLVDMVHTYAGSETDLHKRFVAAGVEYFAIWNTVYFAGVMSIVIGTSNLLPFLPFDGGHIIVAYMSAPWRKRYEYGSRFVIIALIAVAFTSDIMRIMHV